MKGNWLSVAMLLMVMLTLFAPASHPALGYTSDIQAGEIVINEVLANPGGTDDYREYFEIVNVSSRSLDLGNCTFYDASNNTITIAASTVVAAGGYFVFCAAGRLETRRISGSACNYPYAYSSNFSLNNSGAESITISCGSTVIDSMSYSGSTTGTSRSFGLPTGTERNQAHVANDNSANWANSTSTFTYAGTNGSTTDTSDIGTPGAKNDDVLGATAITLRTLTAAAPASPWAAALPLLGLVAAGGAVTWRRRR